jgi:serine/threonine-protein kinase
MPQNAQAQSPYKKGDVVAGKYALDALLGRGAMGEVWRAQNVDLDASVAIKILSARGDRAALRERLLLEAKVAASVTHPAIVKVFDVGETSFGDPFIVMELLNGTSLGALLQTEGRLPAARVLQTLLPIAEALQLAHGRGLVHRDVKPDNIFIVNDEGSFQPKLVDFGIVKIQQQDGGTQLTRAGDVLGSPDYLSPEQARGQSDVDHLTDVWAFCVVLYEAISGRVPFDAPNYNALVRQIIEDDPPPLQQLAVVNEELSAIVARGLSKERSQRYGSMAELGRALARWLIEQGELHDLCGTSLERRWLRGSDSDEHGSTAFVISASRPPEPDAEPPARSREIPLRFAAHALVCAGLGFGFVAWQNGAFRDRRSVEPVAAVAGPRAGQPTILPVTSSAASVAVPVEALLVEAPTEPHPEGAAIRHERDRRDRSRPTGGARSIPAAVGVQARPQPKTDLIKPYE